MRRQVVGWVLASLAVGVSGCQSWSQIGQGMPSGSRVPPPGTGTYPVPSSYYNGAGAKTGAVSSNAQPAYATTASSNAASSNAASPSAGQTASRTSPTTGTASGPSTAPGFNTGAPTTTSTAGYPIPTVDQMRGGINNTASAVLSDANHRANQVVQAGTARAAAAVEKYTDSAPSLRPAGVQPASFSGQPQYSGQSQSAPSSRAAQPGSSPSGAGNSRSLSDSNDAEEDPQLDWQTPQ